MNCQLAESIVTTPYKDSSKSGVLEWVPGACEGTLSPRACFDLGSCPQPIKIALVGPRAVALPSSDFDEYARLLERLNGAPCRRFAGFELLDHGGD